MFLRLLIFFLLVPDAHAVAKRSATCSCGKLVTYTSKGSLAASLARCERTHPDMSEFIMEEVTSASALSIAIVILTYCRHRASAYQTSRRFRQLFTAAGQTCRIFFVFGHDRAKRRAIKGHDVVMRNVQAFWFPKVRDILAVYHDINQVWFLEDDICVRPERALSHFFHEIMSGISQGKEIVWLGWHKKLRYWQNPNTGQRWHTGQGSNLIAFTGDGLQSAYQLLQSTYLFSTILILHFGSRLVVTKYQRFHYLFRHCWSHVATPPEVDLT